MRRHYRVILICGGFLFPFRYFFRFALEWRMYKVVRQDQLKWLPDIFFYKFYRPLGKGISHILVFCKSTHRLFFRCGI